jgi:hypothetical protein
MDISLAWKSEPISGPIVYSSGACGLRPCPPHLHLHLHNLKLASDAAGVLARSLKTSQLIP